MLSQQLVIKDCAIHYKLIGSSNKPLLVFIHAAILDHHMFDKQLDAFKPYFQLLLYDLRGHGISLPEGEPFTMEQSVEDLRLLLDYVHAKEVIFVGSSLGGVVAQMYTQKFPATVKALAWFDGPCIDVPLTMSEKLGLNLFISLIKHRIPNPLTKLHIKQTFQEDTAQYVSISKKVPYKIKVHVWESFYKEITLKKERKFQYTIPVMFGRGEYDTPYKKYLARVTKQMPRIECIVIPRAGHLPNYDKPEVFNKIVLEFLKENKFK